MRVEKGQSRTIPDLDLNLNSDDLNRDENNSNVRQTLSSNVEMQGESINQILSRLSKTNGGASKRYNVVIPQELFDELQTIADRRGVSVVEMLRKFIKLGILASWLEELPDAALIIREGDTDRELLLI